VAYHAVYAPRQVDRSGPRAAQKFAYVTQVRFDLLDRLEQTFLAARGDSYGGAGFAEGLGDLDLVRRPRKRRRIVEGFRRVEQW